MASNEFMPVRDIENKILSNYPYDICDIIPVKFKDTEKQRAVYRFETGSGPKCLKKVYFDEPNLLFVYSVIEWLYRHRVKVPKLLPTKTGGRFVNYRGDLFIVTDWIEGRKCDYDIEEDIYRAAENLGKMHRLTYNFEPVSGSFIRKEDPDWFKTFNRRMLQLAQQYNTASKCRDEFSSIYADSFDYFFARAVHAVHLLSLVDNEVLRIPVAQYNTVCHLDYVNKNLIFSDDGELYVIDFDKARIDIPIHDIGTFLKRILKRGNTSWDYRLMINTLDYYQQQRALSFPEYLCLFAYLEFPQKYWKISRDYYSNRKECNRKLYISMLSSACQQKDGHDDFCTKFNSYIQQKFGRIF